jgi:hypothetical protein
MTVYVDPLMPWGWKMYGKEVDSCHMFSDQPDLTDLHEMAIKIGLKLRYFQNKPGRPHYDLTKSRRDAAIEAGAVEVPFKRAVELWHERDAKLKAILVERKVDT